jgi:hypothetical protein
MNKIIPDNYDGFARWDWMQTLAEVLGERGMVGDHIARYSWDELPDSYKAQYPDPNPDNYRAWFHREKRSAPMHPAVKQAVLQAPPLNWHLLVLEWPHGSDSDPSRIAYTRSDEHGKADRQTVTSVGKYLTRHFPALADHAIRDIAMRHKPYEFKLWDTVSGIVRSVQDGPHSCMKWSDFDSDTDTHPYEVYDPKYGWRAAVRLGTNEMITARCLVNVEEMTFVRSYTRRDSSEQYSHSDEAIEVWLRDQGFTKRCSWSGLKLAKITTGRYHDDFWAPYLDGDCKHVTDAGDHLLITSDGEYEFDRTDGHANGSSSCTCSDCGERVHEDDLRSIGYHGDNHVGECCIGDYVYAHGRGGDQYYIYYGDAINVNDDYYDPDYISRYDIVQLDDGDYVHQDDAVYLEQREIWVASDDDCWVHCNSSCTTEHIDDCVELADGDWALENDAWQCDHDKKWYLHDDVTAFETECGLTVHPDHAHAYITIKEEN